MLYQRLAASAAALLLLGGCSFFGFWSEPERPAEGSKIDSRIEGAQWALLPGYLSDQDVAPGGIEAVQGYIGTSPPQLAPRPLRRPARVSAVVQQRPIAREPTLSDLLPRRQVLDLQPIASALRPGSFSLADLIADRDWRKQTSETLNRLFQ